MGRIIRWAGHLLFVVVTVCFAAGWVAGAWLVKPERKELQDFHREWMGDVGSHGMKVGRLETVSGIPYLVCEPAGELGNRGRILRTQMEREGWKLGPFGESVGTLVMLHGRGGRKEDLLLTAERFCAVGLRCVIPDLPGHGENRTAIAGFGAGDDENVLPKSVLRDAALKIGFRPQPAALWGMSMGGSYAIRAASGANEWDALVVVSTFESLDAVVSPLLSSRIGLLAPLVRVGLGVGAWSRGVSVGAVRPVRWALDLQIPVLLVHGKNDELIHVRQARKIFAAVPSGRKFLMEVPTGRHGNVLVTPDLVYAEMAAWVLTAFHERAL